MAEEETVQGVRVAVYVNGRQKRRCKEVQRQRYVKTWQAGSTTKVGGDAICEHGEPRDTQGGAGSGICEHGRQKKGGAKEFTERHMSEHGKQRNTARSVEGSPQYVSMAAREMLHRSRWGRQRICVSMAEEGLGVQKGSGICEHGRNQAELTTATEWREVYM
jgi:hypothetical protein